jgi:hypothetical protein
MKQLGIILTLTILTSCAWFQEEETDQVVARVDDVFLYASDLEVLNTSSMNPEDSVKITKTFVNNWVRQQLVLRKAELNLTDSEKDIDELVESYRNSLIRNRYESKLIDQYLDTLVKRSEVKAYYDAHLDDFMLEENILKFLMVQVDPEAPKMDILRDNFPPEDDEQYVTLEEYVMQFAFNSYLTDTIWYNFRDFNELVPVGEVDEKDFLRRTNFIELSDSNHLYLVSVRDYRLMQSYSPLSYVERTIQKLILHQRKLDLIKKMEEDLFYDGMEKGIIELFE